ncbi:hypothetical protein [Cupriavidus sp. AU9028]|uniref:hypothetical protein n=1 Tax=Cupriavidus sp. AU9028 TaxID=2871157 RepID=UPI001C94CC6E|nr:hypothetical protein [Cupriavidus sp. AU9028]MBY4897527.1 hypothetical protein [Cupriavidus sp. AU9028]
MSTSLLPQEIYLLERYSSVEYFGEMRDAWRETLHFVEDSLSRFMARLPADLRQRPLPMQPDVVWGQRVLPHFRDTAAILDGAFIRLTHGDADALRSANAVVSDVRGQRDFSSDWLDEVAPGGSARYGELLHRADRLASNIFRTAAIGWVTGALSHRYSPRSRGELDRPAVWPRYELDGSVQVRTGELVPESGIYLPDVAEAASQFLIGGFAALPAMTGFDGQQYTAKVPAVWTRVRRMQQQKPAFL